MLLVTSELEAVNIILSSVGADVVDSIDTDVDVDVSNACRMLERVSRDIQRKGWDFNTETVVMHPSKTTKRILWDNTLLSYKATDGKTYVKRGDYLYNITDSTYEFDNSVELKVIRAVDFDDLPDVFRNYIAAKAAYSFQQRYMGDNNASQDLMMEVQELYADIVDYEIHMGNYNMLQFIQPTNVMQRT